MASRSALSIETTVDTGRRVGVLHFNKPKKKKNLYRNILNNPKWLQVLRRKPWSKPSWKPHKIWKPNSRPSKSMPNSSNPNPTLLLQLPSSFPSTQISTFYKAPFFSSTPSAPLHFLLGNLSSNAMRTLAFLQTS